MGAARGDETRNFLRAQTAETLDAFSRRKTFQVRLFGRAEDLDPFFGEVIIEAGEREAGTVDGGLANLAMKTDALAFEFQVQLLAVGAIETLDRDDRDILALI